MRDKGMALIVLVVLVAADGAAWFQMFAGAPARASSISFLDVGQGDSSLLEFAGGVKIMTDAGPDSSVVGSLERSMKDGGRYIDIAIVTHPELDHFNGFDYMLARYEVGVFVINGRNHPGSKQWVELLKKIAAKKIPLVTLGAGDVIRYGPNRIDVLSPNAQLIGSSELNDAGIVQKVRTSDFSVLLVADIGINVEEYLRGKYGSALAADILKVGHHGSKYSSGAVFLKAVRPLIAAISVAARNTYGHPTPEALGRLAAVGAQVFRTDQMGTLTARRVDGELRIFSEK
jgi:beta-lactamase superfamily II metal-dependent hydrolase